MNPGFSPAEMALPNHPEVCYEFVKTLKEAGYWWVLVQEHTIEDPETAILSAANPYSSARARKNDIANRTSSTWAGNVQSGASR